MENVDIDPTILMPFPDYFEVCPPVSPIVCNPNMHSVVRSPYMWPLGEKLFYPLELFDRKEAKAWPTAAMRFKLVL